MSLAIEEMVVHHQPAGGGEPRTIGPLTVRIDPGEIVGLAGPSGSGKTTAAQVLAGIRAPDAGRRLLDGRPTTRWGWSAPPEVRRRVQLVPQLPHLACDPRLTLRRSLAIPLRRHRISYHQGLEWLSHCEFDPALLDRRPDQVSGGQLQRFVLARALTVGPDHLVVDEATSAQDAITTATIARLLRTVATDGTGVLLISHDTTLLDQLCSTQVAMDQEVQRYRSAPLE